MKNVRAINGGEFKTAIAYQRPGKVDINFHRQAEELIMAGEKFPRNVSGA